MIECRQSLEVPLQAIGQRELAARGLHGAAIVKAGVIREVDLELRAGEPPSLHADIIGWPGQLHDPELGKAERKERAGRSSRNGQVSHFGSEAYGHGGVTPQHGSVTPGMAVSPRKFVKAPLSIGQGRITSPLVQGGLTRVFGPNTTSTPGPTPYPEKALFRGVPPRLTAQLSGL